MQGGREKIGNYGRTGRHILKVREEWDDLREGAIEICRERAIHRACNGLLGEEFMAGT